MNQQSIDLSNYGKQTTKSIGYYDSTTDELRKTYIPPSISITSNTIILLSIIFSIIIFISQFCLNNLGIPTTNNNMCQQFFFNTYNQYYYILIPLCIFIFIYSFSILDIIIDYFNQQYYNYKNNYPNIFSTFLNADYNFGSINIFLCSVKSLINFDSISNLLNKKKEYEII